MADKKCKTCKKSPCKCKGEKGPMGTGDGKAKKWPFQPFGGKSKK